MCLNIAKLVMLGANYCDIAQILLSRLWLAVKSARYQSLEKKISKTLVDCLSLICMHSNFISISTYLITV